MSDSDTLQQEEAKEGSAFPKDSMDMRDRRILAEFISGERIGGDLALYWERYYPEYDRWTPMQDLTRGSAWADMIGPYKAYEWLAKKLAGEL